MTAVSQKVAATTLAAAASTIVSAITEGAGDPVTVGAAALTIFQAVVGYLVPHRPVPRPRRKPKPAPAKPFSPRFGVDWAWGTIRPSALRQAGASFACRYLSLDPSKNLTPSESAWLRRAGVDRVVVWETTAARALGGPAAGRIDASNAFEQARRCGLPKGGSWAIYFAIDFDATGPDVEPYFRGVVSVLRAEHTGAYGGLKPLRHLFSLQLIRYGWQSYAWSGGAWDFRAQLRQISNGHRIAGVDCDFNRAVQPDFGQW